MEEKTDNIDILEEKEKKAIKDLKELSHYCSLRAIDIDDKYSDLWARYIVSIQIVKNLIETLIAENKELKEEKEELKIIKSGIQALETNFANDDTYYVIGKRGFLKGKYRKLLDDYIPKSKVEEKIEELEIEQESNREDLQIAIDNLLFPNIDKIADKISINMSVRGILQSLLGKE